MAGTRVAELYVGMSLQLNQLKQDLAKGAELVNSFVQSIQSKKISIEMDQSALQSALTKLESFVQASHKIYEEGDKFLNSYIEKIKGVGKEAGVVAQTIQTASKGINVEQIKGVGTETTGVAKVVKIAAAEIESAFSSMSISIGETLSRIQSGFSKIAQLQHNTKYSTTQFEEFSKAARAIEEYQTKIEQAAAQWELYQNELVKVKNMNAEQFLSYMGDAADSSAGKLENYKNKVKEVAEAQVQFSGKGVSPAEQYHQDNVAALVKTISETKKYLDEDYQLYYQNVQKVRQLDKGSATERASNLRKNLSELIDDQNKYGVSIENLKAQLKTWLAIQKEAGSLLPEESVHIQNLITQVDILGKHYGTSAELQAALYKQSAGSQLLGETYSAISAKGKVYDSVLKDIVQTTSQFISLSTPLTATEKQYQSDLVKTQQALEKRSQALIKLNELETLVGKRSSVQKSYVDEGGVSRVTPEYKQLDDMVLKVNADIHELSQIPINLNIDNLNGLKEDLDTARKNISQQMEQIVQTVNEKTKNFKIQYSIEAQGAKEDQQLVEATQRLRELGAAERENINNKKLHYERIQELEKAYKILKFPQEQMVAFLKDETAIRKSQLETMKSDHAVRGRGISDRIEEQRATIDLIRTEELYTELQGNLVEGTKEYAQAQEKAEKFMKRLSNQAQESTGRYRGVQKALQSIVGDIKNIIQIQIRWYASQALIFKSIAMVGKVLDFYKDLEVQVAKVTAAMSAQGNVAKTNTEVHALLAREMVRTGKSAEDLATILWELVSAGLSHQAAMAGVAQVTNLAVAAQLDLTQTMRIASGLYRVFGDQLNVIGGATEKWEYIVDRLSATLNQSQADMDGLVSGLEYLINEADAAGVEFEQVLGILSVLNNRLLLGSKAGRSASRVLTQLTSNAKELTKAFGIDVDFSGTLDLLDLLKKLNVVIERNTVNGQINIETFGKLQDIFGQVGKRAAVGLIKNLKELEKTTEDLKSDKFVGMTEAMANVKLEPLAVKIDKVSNALMLLGTVIIEPFAVFASYFVDFFSTVGQLSNALPPVIIDMLKMITSILGVGTAGSALIAVMRALNITLATGLTNAIGRGVLALYEMATAAKTAAVAMTTLEVASTASLKSFIIMGSRLFSKAGIAAVFALITSSATAVGVAIAAVVVGLVSLGYGVYKAKTRLSDLNDELAKTRANYLDTLDMIEQEADNFEKLATQYKNAIPYTDQWLQLRNKILDKYPGYLSSLDAELVVTNDIANTLKEFIEQKRQEYELKKVLAAFDDKSNEQLEESEKSLKKVTRQLLAYNKILVTTGHSGKFFDVQMPGNPYAPLGRTMTTDMMKDVLKDQEKALVQYAMNYKRVFGEELPNDMIPLIRMLSSLKSPLESLLVLNQSLGESMKEGFKITPTFLRLFDDIDPKIRQAIKDLGIKFHIGAELDTKQVNEVYNVLSKMTDNIVSKEATKNVTTQFKSLINGIKTLWEDAYSSGNNFAAFTELPAEKIVELAKEVEQTLPLAVQKALILNKTSLNDIVLQAINANNKLLENVDTLPRGLLKVSEDVEKKLGSLTPIINAEYIGLSNSIIKETARLGYMLPNQWVLIRKRLSNEFRILGEEGQKYFLKRIGEDADKFLDFINNKIDDPGGIDKLGKAFKNLSADIAITSPALQSFINRLNEGMYSLNESTTQLVASMGKLVGATRPAITEYLETNKDVVEEALRYLPAKAQQVLRQTTTLENLELLKMVKETKNKIREELGSLSVQPSAGLYQTVALRQFTKMYEGIITTAKSAYEVQQKLQQEWEQSVRESVANIQTDYSSAVEKQVDIEKQKFDILQKYAKLRENLATEEETAKILAFDPEILKNYQEAQAHVDLMTKSFKKLEEQTLADNKALEITSKGITTLYEEFDKTKQKTVLTETNLFKAHEEELKKFAGAPRANVEKVFNDIYKDLSKEQQVFFDKTINVLMVRRGFDEAATKEWLQNIVQIGINNGVTTFKEIAELLSSKLASNIENTARVREQVNVELQQAISKSTDLFLEGITSSTENTEKLQNIKRRYAEIRLQETVELLEAEYKATSDHYKRLESIRDRDLKKLEDYKKTYQEIMSPQEVNNVLNKELALELARYDEKRKQRELDLKHAIEIYNATASLKKKEAELLRSTPLLSIDDEQWLNDLQKKVDELKIKQQELIEKGKEEFQKTTTDTVSTPSTELTQEEYGRLKAYSEETQKIKDKIEEGEKYIKEVRERSVQARQVDIQREKLLTKTRLAALKGEISAISVELKAMKTIQIEEISGLVRTQFKELEDSIKIELQNTLHTAVSEVEKIDFNYGQTVRDITAQSVPELQKLAITLQETFNKTLTKAVKEGSLTPSEIADYTAKFQHQLETIYLDAYGNIELLLLEQQMKIKEQSLTTLDTSLSLNIKSLDLSSLDVLKVKTQGLLDIQHQITESYEDQRKFLKDNIELRSKELAGEMKSYNELKNTNRALEGQLREKISALASTSTTSATKNDIEAFAGLVVQLNKAYEEVKKAEEEKSMEEINTARENYNALEEGVIKRQEALGLVDVELNTLIEINKKQQEINNNSTMLGISYKKIKDYTAEVKDDMESIKNLVRTQGTGFEKFILGLSEATDELRKAAFDWEQIGKDAIGSINSALADGLSQTIDQIALMLSGVATEEEVGLQEDLMNKQQEILEVKQKIADLELGGVQMDEVNELESLKRQLQELQKEAAKFTEELNIAGDDSKKLADIWKNVAKSIVDSLIKIATEMLAVIAIESTMNILKGIIGSIGSIGGGSTAAPTRLMAAKGGILPGGYSHLTNNKETYNIVEKLFGAKMFSSGGLATGPVLGVVGEGGRNEAVVPLPDNRSIPVTFTGDKSKDSGVKIMNIVDPAMIPSVLLENPETVINIIGDNVQRRGALYHTFKTLALENK